MKPVLNTLIGFFLFLATTAFAQGELEISFNPPAVGGAINSMVTVDVVANKFTGVSTIQFPILFDKNIVQVSQIIITPDNPLGLTYLPTGGNIAFNNTTGRVVLSWNDPGGEAVSLPPGTVLFQVKFTVIAAGSSTLYIANSGPFQIEVTGPGGSAVTFTYPTPPTPPISGFAVYPINEQVRPGEILCAPIKVNDFNSIIGMSFAITWNPAIFTFRNTQAYNLPGMSCNTFNSTLGPGKLAVVWDDPTTVGQTLINGASLFEVCLTAIGSAPSTSTLVAGNINNTTSGAASAIPAGVIETNIWGASSGVPATIGISTTAPRLRETIHLQPDTMTINTGNTAVVPFRAFNFRKINGFDFVVSYDQSVMTYTSRLLALPPATPNTINQDTVFRVTPIAGFPGKLRVYWRDYPSVGETVADSSVLFSLTFTLVGAPGAISPVSIGNLASAVPTAPMRVGEGPSSCRFITPTVQDGFVRLGATAPLAVALTTKTDVSCFGAGNGSINITVTGGAASGTTTYNWTGPGITPANKTLEDPTGLTPGSYQVTVTRGSSTATLTAAVVITQPAAALGVSGLNIVNVKCFGETDGTISLNTTGGTSPYTYLWTGGATTEDRTGLGAGNYQLTITDSRNCTFVTTAPGYTVTAPMLPLSVNLVSTSNIKCFGQSNGGAVINVSNAATGPSFYEWKSQCGAGGQVASIQNPTNLPVGTYKVTVTDANSCTAVIADCVTINGPSAALNVNTAVVTPTPCAGVNNGSISLGTPTGGWGSYTITWTPTLSGFNPTGVAAGNYTATISDNGGCTVVRTAQVALGTPAITVTSNVVTPITCFNQGNGSIALTLSGAFTSINWTGPNGPAGSGTTISNLAGGTYTATVTYGNGCTLTATNTVNNPDAITAATTTTQQTPSAGGAVDLTVMGGVAPYTYVWNTVPVQTTQDISNVPAAIYTVTITDGRGCQKTVTAEVENSCAVCAATYAAAPACEADGCITVNVPVGSLGPFTVNYTNGVLSDTKIFTNVTVLDICGLAAGTYNVTVSDGSGSSTSTSQTIGQRPQVIITSSTNNPTVNNKNGSIQVTPGPSLPLTFQWSSNVPPQYQTSQFIPAVLDSGYYCVTVTNQLPMGCEKVYCFTLVREYPPVIEGAAAIVASPKCVGAPDGSINITVSGGDETFTYSWVGTGGYTATTQDVSGLSAGTYNCTVTDGRGVTKTFGPYTLTAQSLLSITNVNELSVFGGGFQVSGATVCDGQAAAVVSGASGTVTYLWSNGATGVTNNTLCAGAYSVVATDALGCTSAWTGDLTAPTALNPTSSMAITYNGFGVSCNEACDGAARVGISGGVAPYVVAWPSGKVEQLFNSIATSLEDQLCAGSHVVTITDNNGVVTQSTIVLTEPDPISITFTDVEPSRLSNCDAEIILFATGTTGDIDVTWLSQFRQGDGVRAGNLCADEVVKFTLIDANGCTATAEHQAPFPDTECFKPNPVLTPNGDGKNDFFEINCFPTTTNTLEIYDRWNRAVAPKYVNYQNNWDGKSSGTDLPEGVYFYVGTFTDDQGTVRTIKGYFNLLR